MLPSSTQLFKVGCSLYRTINKVSFTNCYFMLLNATIIVRVKTLLPPSTTPTCYKCLCVWILSIKSQSIPRKPFSSTLLWDSSFSRLFFFPPFVFTWKLSDLLSSAERSKNGHGFYRPGLEWVWI